jgi:tetratricopeptide (TPR) repeat protein
LAKSFREEDRVRIRPVETFLESFAKLGVETETGEPSEPESISLKVRERIDRAAVFVAVLTARFPICPMQERFQALWNSILGRIVAWSAPPWVLQECGYAIARGCDLILFLEPNVDLGGLQGDYEYIQYDYRNPAPALTRASFMLNSLIARRLGAVMRTTIDVRSEVPPAQVPLSSEPLAITKEVPGPEEEDALQPIFDEIIVAFNERDFKRAAQLFEDGKEVLASQSAAELEVSWAILYYGRLTRAGMTEGLDGLRAMAKLHPDSPRIPKAIADYLMSYNEFEEASVQLRRAEELSKTPERYEYILQRCTCLLKEGKRSDAQNLLLAIVNDSANASSEFRSRLMMALFSMFKESDEVFFGFAIAEVGLRENPADAALRFKLGYEYSEAKYFELNVFHTKALVDHDPKDAGSTHNLGVAFDNLSMPIASVSHYKRALDLGESLSASVVRQTD